jgi:fibro-slime domain-containing protein
MRKFYCAESWNAKVKKISSFLYNQSGVISVVVLVILLGVGVLALNTALNSNMNQTSSNNYKFRIQTFHAADGLMTMLAQDMVDTGEDNYLHDNMLDLDIGAPAIKGSHSYNPFKDIDTIKGGGSDIWNSSDQFHFFYTRVKGDVDVSVKVISLTNTDSWAKGGIMIREKLTGNSKHATVLRPYSAANGIKLQFRRSDGAITIDSTLTPYQDAYWIRIKRAGNNFTAYRSSNGSSWVPVDSRTIPMTDSVYVGLAVTSHNSGSVCTGQFTNLKGLTRRSCSDSTFVGINNDIPVKYTIDEVGAGIFSMSTNAYKLKGTARKQNFNTCLNQTIYRERTQTWQAEVHDSALIPVVFYDMRADMSNPEFNVYVTVFAPCPPCTSASSGVFLFPQLIQTNALSADRKIIKKNPIPSFRTSFMSCWDPSWYSISPNTRTSIMNDTMPFAKIANSIQSYSSFSWCFNDSMHTWFRPWGDSAGKTGVYTFDYLNARWSGLKVRPGWTHGPEHDTEWVAQHWDSTNRFANIVMYDTLKFIEDSLNPGIFSFGKDQSDPRWFLSCNDLVPYDTVYAMWSPKFMPLQKRGFGYDSKNRYWVGPAGDAACFVKQNFGFTMEIHRSFDYKKGQVFEFKGDDDVWVFINDHCVINLAGVHGASYGKVNLDTLGLSEGKNYMFDFFYTERNVTESNILITTNMLLFTPPQTAKRNWKRDYGNID